MPPLNNIHRHAVVTGASSGLGLSMTNSFLEAGIRVTAVCRSRPAITHPAFQHLASDLTAEGQIDKIFECFEADFPDLWVNNAGFGMLGAHHEVDPDVRDSLLKILYQIPVDVARRLAERWGSGDPETGELPCLIQVSSLAVELPIPLMPHYNAAKSALSAFCASLLLDGNNPFRLIDFRPGDFNTPFVGKSAMRPRPKHIEFHELLCRRHKRAPSPDKAATRLTRALERRHEGILRSGGFFQSAIAPLGARVLSQRRLHQLIRRYYGIR